MFDAVVGDDHPDFVVRVEMHTDVSRAVGVLRDFNQSFLGRRRGKAASFGGVGPLHLDLHAWSPVFWNLRAAGETSSSTSWAQVGAASTVDREGEDAPVAHVVVPPDRCRHHFFLATGQQWARSNCQRTWPKSAAAELQGGSCKTVQSPASRCFIGARACLGRLGRFFYMTHRGLAFLEKVPCVSGGLSSIRWLHRVGGTGVGLRTGTLIGDDQANLAPDKEMHVERPARDVVFVDGQRFSRANVELPLPGSCLWGSRWVSSISHVH